MAKYIGSPWGYISGKLGGCVGSSCRGIPYIRVWSPHKEGTGSVRLYLAHLENPDIEFSAKQMNIRRAIYGMLVLVIKNNMAKIIHPIWEEYCKKHKYILTGADFFIKINVSPLYGSIPHSGKIFSANNLPYYPKMLISYGELEQGSKMSAQYVNEEKIVIRWSGETFKNGTPDDIAYCGIYRVPNEEEMSNFKPYGSLYIPEVNGLRKDERMEININGLKNYKEGNKFVAYLYFRNESIGYSNSIATKVTDA